jgi:hypothetical protein
MRLHDENFEGWAKLYSYDLPKKVRDANTAAYYSRRRREILDEDNSEDRRFTKYIALSKRPLQESKLQLSNQDSEV